MKNELFQDLIESIKEGAAIMKGALPPSRSFEFPETEVKALRKRFGLSQVKFACLVGISVGTLRNWEQGRRKPEGPARVLLQVASLHPHALLDIAEMQVSGNTTLGKTPKSGRKKTCSR